MNLKHKYIMKSLLKCVSAILKTINANGTIELKDVPDFRGFKT